MEYLRIKELLRERGITGKDLSAILGITENSLSMIINGKRQPRFELLSQIATTLDVDMKDLFHTTLDKKISALYKRDQDGNFKQIGELFES